MSKWRSPKSWPSCCGAGHQGWNRWRRRWLKSSKITHRLQLVGLAFNLFQKWSCNKKDISVRWNRNATSRPWCARQIDWLYSAGLVTRSQTWLENCKIVHAYGLGSCICGWFAATHVMECDSRKVLHIHFHGLAWSHFLSPANGLLGPEMLKYTCLQRQNPMKVESTHLPWLANHFQLNYWK